MKKAAKPTPRCDGLNGEFYAFCAKGELRFQRCSDCGSWRHMPRYTCAKCGSNQWTWQRSSGFGKLYTWTVTHRAFHPGFDDDVPYAVAVVEMDEGVRMVSSIIETSLDQLTLNMPVELAFRGSEGFQLPVFRRAM